MFHDDLLSLLPFFRWSPTWNGWEKSGSQTMKKSPHTEMQCQLRQIQHVNYTSHVQLHWNWLPHSYVDCTKLPSLQSLRSLLLFHQQEYPSSATIQAGICHVQPRTWASGGQKESDLWILLNLKGLSPPWATLPCKRLPYPKCCENAAPSIEHRWRE